MTGTLRRFPSPWCGPGGGSASRLPADQAWMPRPGELREKYGGKPLTRDFAYIRFLGERERIEKMTTKWDKLVIDRTGG